PAAPGPARRSPTRPRAATPSACARTKSPSSTSTARPWLAPGDAQSDAERRRLHRSVIGVGRQLHLEPRPFEQPDQLRRAARPRQTDLEVDDAADDQVRERLLHRLHAAPAVGLHDRIDLLDLAL